MGKDVDKTLLELDEMLSSCLKQAIEEKRPAQYRAGLFDMIFKFRHYIATKVYGNEGDDKPN